MNSLDSLIEQVSSGTATSEDGDHLVQIYYGKIIRTDDKVRSVQQASHYLHTGEWGPVVSTCGDADCCRPDHLEEQALALVAQHHQAVSLADLYRKGRSRGLLTARTEYGG